MKNAAKKRKEAQGAADPLLLAFVRALARDLAQSHIRDSRRKASKLSEDDAGETQ
jgi:hypothetical protein